MDDSLILLGNVGSQGESALQSDKRQDISRSVVHSFINGANKVPAHLYSLERFVSPELDSATESFFSEANMMNISPRTSDILDYGHVCGMRVHVNEGDSSLDLISPEMPSGFLDRRMRRKSFIQLSLSESFS